MLPKKFVDESTTATFKSWAREARDYTRMADPAVIELMKIGDECKWKRIDPNDINGAKNSAELDQDLHYFLSRFLDGEAKLLALNAEIGEFGKEYKSGAELWRLLNINYEKMCLTT